MAAADILGREVAAAAAALANARAGRRGAPPIANILDVLPEMILDNVVADARAVVEALEALPPRTRPSGALRAADAAILGRELRAPTVAILIRQPGGVADGVVWADSGESAVLAHQPADGLLRAIAAVLRDGPGVTDAPDRAPPV